MSVMLPGGKYVLSDPCYVLRGELYDKFLTAHFSGEGQALTEIDGHKLAVFSTKYGDGLYHDEQGRAYGVDAGCIACVPVELVDGANEYSHDQFFAGDFFCEFDDGVIRFGHVAIDTDPQEEYSECSECGCEVDECDDLCDSCEAESEDDDF